MARRDIADVQMTTTQTIGLLTNDQLRGLLKLVKEKVDGSKSVLTDK